VHNYLAAPAGSHYTMGMSIRDLLRWQSNGGGYALHYGRRTTAVLHVVPDKTYPAMWRIRLPDGSLSDMANLMRAKDAARDRAQSILDGRGNSSDRLLEPVL
jgi:hypothetical protein